MALVNLIVSSSSLSMSRMVSLRRFWTSSSPYTTLYVCILVGSQICSSADCISEQSSSSEPSPMMTTIQHLATGPYEA